MTPYPTPHCVNSPEVWRSERRQAADLRRRNGLRRPLPNARCTASRIARAVTRRGNKAGFARLRPIELSTADHPILPRICGKMLPEFLRYLDREFLGGKMQLEER